MRPPLAVRYLLAGTALFGGVKVVLRQAQLLARRGHNVSFVSAEPKPDWFDIAQPFIVDPAFDLRCLPAVDVTVATFWTTLEPAARDDRGAVAHYCQGFEASYTHNEAEHPSILDAYRLPVPAMAVSPHLVELLAERFGRPGRVVPQPLEPWFSPENRTVPGTPPRVLVPSPFEIDWKGVATALRALVKLRASGFPFRLVRLSQWPLSETERELIEPDEFHCHLAPPRVAELMRGCDLLLAPSWEQEGFGLPALEAMASGVPVVASDVSCYRGFAAEAARLVSVENTSAFARAARELMLDGSEWQRRRASGLAVAARFSEELAASAAEEALYWIASGAWRGGL